MPQIRRMLRSASWRGSRLEEPPLLRRSLMARAHTHRRNVKLVLSRKIYCLECDDYFWRWEMGQEQQDNGELIAELLERATSRVTVLNPQHYC